MFRRFVYIVEKNLNLKRSFDNEKDITKEEMEDLIKQGVKVIDVRSPQEYREGHIDGAICIPDYKIKREVMKKIPNKDEKIVLYCETGHRSTRVQQMLNNMGYENVYNVYEGIQI